MRNGWGTFSLEMKAEKEISVLHCKGRIVAGNEVSGLRSAIFSQPSQNIVVDLAKVTAVDAAGLGLFVEAHAWASRSGRRIMFLNPEHKIARVLQLMNLNEVLDIYTTAHLEPTDTRAGGSGLNVLCGCVA